MNFLKKCLSETNCSDFNVFFVPLFVNNNHWSLLVFNTINKTIKQFDSLYSPNLELINRVTNVLSQVLNILKDAPGWSIDMTENYPKQSNTFDCGVFICTYARCLAFNTDFYFNQVDMPNIRKIIRSEILNYSIDSSFLKKS